MPYDGNPRGCYVVVEDGEVSIRRVEYDVEAEVQLLLSSGYPHAEWLAVVRRHAKYIQPF